MTVFFILPLIPSNLTLSTQICGMMPSIKSKNAMPIKNPAAAGIQALLPCSTAISIEGISNDHTDAAIITPAANPKSSFSMVWFNWFFIKNTIAAPNVVPVNGIIKPTIKLIFMLTFSHFIHYIIFFVWEMVTVFLRYFQLQPAII